MTDGPTEQETLRNVLLQSGGLAASRSVLVGAVGRGALGRAMAAGVVVRLHRGLYALPEVDESVRLARQAGGLLCLTSAALFHRWEVKAVPELPHILLPRGRAVPARLAGRASWHRGDVAADDISEQVATGRSLTLAQCLRALPDDEALAIADSALRAGEELTLRRIAQVARGPRAPRMRRIPRPRPTPGRPTRSSRCCAASARRLPACTSCRNGRSPASRLRCGPTWSTRTCAS